jgi:hypothetical protein
MRDPKRIAVLLLHLWENSDSDTLELRLSYSEDVLGQLMFEDYPNNAVPVPFPIEEINQGLSELAEQNAGNGWSTNPQLVIEDHPDLEYYTVKDNKKYYQFVNPEDIEETIELLK